MANGRQKVSDRTFIDVDGNEVDKMESATGARYTLVGVGKSFDQQFGAAGTPATMFAIFGFWTKIGNVANTALHEKDDAGNSCGTSDDAASDIQEFMDSVAAGTWRESGLGATRGPKYDNAIIAHVLHEMLDAGGKAQGDVAHYQGRIEADKGYRAKVLANPGVKTAYYTELAKRGSTTAAPSVDGLA